MAELTTKRRDKLKAHVFGLPKERKYPMQDKAHAANAKARATQQLEKGNLTKSEADAIRRKANLKLYGKKSDDSQMPPEKKGTSKKTTKKKTSRSSHNYDVQDAVDNM